MARKLLAVACTGALLLAGQAHAADVQLSDVKGKVLVSRDGKISQAAPGAVAAGDRVIAADGGARLTFADGCVIVMKPSAMVTVSAKSPCAGGAGLVSAGASSAQAAASPGLSTLQWAGVGITVVMLGVGLAAAADDLSISN